MDGAARPGKMSPIVKWGGGFIVVLIALGVIGSIALPEKTPARAPDPTAVTSTTPVPKEDDAPMTNEQAAQALSDYVAVVQAKFFTMGGMSQLYLSKLRQDAEFRNQDRMHSDASEMMAALKQIDVEIETTPTPINVTDDVGALFGKVSDAAGTVASATVSIAADVAVYAHTGLSDEASERQDAADVKKAQRDFEAATYAAYKALGVPRDRVNPKTLTLKP